MSNLDTNDSFSHMWYIWRFVGIYPYTELKWLYNLYGILVNLVASVINPALVLVNVLFLEDIGLMMHCLQAGLTLIVSSIKQFVIFMRLSDLHKVRPLLNKLDRRASRNYEEVEYLENIIKQCRFMALAIEIAFVLSLSSFAVPGIIKRRLVFEGWFPFDWTSSEAHYLFAFTFQLMSTMFQIIQNAANDAYPPIYINVLIAHIHVLCMRVRRIGKDSRLTLDEHYEELKACVRDHKTIISLFESIKPVIAQTVLIQFIITAFVLCITVVYFLIFNREVGQLISTVIYLVAIVSEAFPVCYFGNALIAETDGLTTAIYNCNWMDQPVKFRKCLIIFMQRSQKTNIIQAGGLASITLQTFTAIIRFSFSMFTLLSQLQ